MRTGHHLAIGEKLAGHYEILQVLGEDEFEILYLVKDLHMANEKFVLKELFLSAYASRGERGKVEVVAKAKQSFEKTKQDIIDEIEKLKQQNLATSPKYYGYFEENHTLYTIMEFVNRPNISSYLTPSPEVVFEEEVKESQTIDSPSKQKKEKPKSNFFLKLLIMSLLLFLGLLYYSYNMIQEDKEKAQKRATETVKQVEATLIKHPPLEDKTQEEEAEENLSVKIPEVVEPTIPEGASYIDEENMTQQIEEVKEENLTNTPDDLSQLPIAETFPMEEIPTPMSNLPQVAEPPVIPEPQIIETPFPKEQHSNSALGTRIN